MEKAKINNQHDLRFSVLLQNLFLSPIEENYAFILGKKL